MMQANRKFVIRAMVIPAVALLAIYLWDRFTVDDPPSQKQQQQGGIPRRHRDGGWTLVLDLDETLVHTNDDLTLFRPHVATFLSQVFARFDRVVVFTAGTKPYADPILDALESMASVRFHGRLYRDSCTPLPPGQGGQVGWVKDLTRVQKNLRKLLIVDNMTASYAMHPQCGVPIPSYWGQPNDVELLIMLSTLSARLQQQPPHKVR
jgi:TFIIF-interacting CTD phosphatase-like protein